MSHFRTWQRTIKFLRQAMLVMSCSLIPMGGLVWIDNLWAVLPDNDLATPFDSLIIFDALNGAVDCDYLDPDGDGQIPLAGGKLPRRNGDQDDNKPEPLWIVVRVGAIVTPNRSDQKVGSSGH